jgi:hypothetical protein|nr:MAG TPA: hypothetical protein [Caudoviricetes sp.]
MTKIPAETKAKMISFGTNAKFTKQGYDFLELNAGITGLVKKAVANQIADDQPYTFQINFRNGMIVGQTFDPRFSIQKLEGRRATSEFTLGNEDPAKYYELKKLDFNFQPSITNGDSWVARIKMVNGGVVDAFINSDFDDPEERKLMRDALLRGFKSPERM